MTRKLTIAGVCVVVAGLLALAVLRGGKRTYSSEPRPNNFSVTVDLKTNNNAKSR